MIPTGQNIHDIVKSLIAMQGWTLTGVVDRINQLHPEKKKTTVQNISNKLTRGTIKFNEVIEISNIIGLEISWNSSHMKGDRANGKE